jgi:3-dehydrosphinganine reductase
MVASKVQNGRIVFVSSFLGMAGIVGYNGYCGGKYAIRGKFLCLSFGIGWTNCWSYQYTIGLADALRSEVMLYQKALNLKIHLYIPAGISSPGYDEEQKTKPAATRKIEEADVPMKPDECARMLLSGTLRFHLNSDHSTSRLWLETDISCTSCGTGMNKGYYQITNDFITDLVRTQTRGAVPWNNPIYDLALSIIGFVSLGSSCRLTVILVDLVYYHYRET